MSHRSKHTGSILRTSNGIAVLLLLQTVQILRQRRAIERFGIPFVCSSNKNPLLCLLFTYFTSQRVHPPVSSHLSTGTGKKSLARWPRILWIARVLKFVECNPAHRMDLSILFIVRMDIEVALPCHIQYKLIQLALLNVLIF